MPLATILGIMCGPILAMVLFGVIAVLIKLAIVFYFPDGWIKRQLLAERFHSPYSQSNRKILSKGIPPALKH